MREVGTCMPVGEGRSHAAVECGTSGSTREVDPWRSHRHSGPRSDQGETAGRGEGADASYPPPPPTSIIESRSSHLAPLFGHLWEKTRVCHSSSPPSRDSFGWWRGKVGGDERSFAHVVGARARGRGASSASMGDRGGGRSGGWRDSSTRGGFGGGRKTAQANPSRHMVWQRPDPPPPPSGGARSGGGTEDRWEAAARAMGGDAKARANTTTSTAQTASSAAVGAPDPAAKVNDKLCLNCNLPAEKSYEEKTDEISGDEMERSPCVAGNMKKDYVVWPSLPHIVPLDEGSTEGGIVTVFTLLNRLLDRQCMKIWLLKGRLRADSFRNWSVWRRRPPTD
nr:uncharacterized protein LOC120962749 isoform X1 [Aegilops tauschii subsp. strangulata]